jgi:hypothetical protein
VTEHDRAFLGLSWIVWGCLGLSWIVWACLGLSGFVWACLGLYWLVWAWLDFDGLGGACLVRESEKSYKCLIDSYINTDGHEQFIELLQN